MLFRPWLAVVALLVAASASAADSLSAVVRDELTPQLAYLVQRLDAEGEAFTLDGVAVLKSGDKFLPGKVALGIADLIEASPPEQRAAHLRSFRRVAELTRAMPNDTWGIYYYMLALDKLRRLQLLEPTLGPELLVHLRQQLDWRKFVRADDFTLIRLPTNYYGVAFGVARLRTLLGWESDAAGQKLLAKMLEHYRRYSGEYGFSDETEGEGRFDRYSILLIAEICERFLETDVPVTDELRATLRKAVDVALMMTNTRGDGFSYGRSLGPYGDTAVLEILSVAAELGVLKGEEKDIAYAYSHRIVRKYVDFWFDGRMHSVDLWNQGRRTDAYRAKHRILGENFSLLHQIISASERWNAAGYRDKKPREDLQAWADGHLPPFKFVWFAKGEYDRALALVRDRDIVFSLPLINGGVGQHANSPYYPLPFAHQLVAGVADSTAAQAQLIPKFVLDDGSELLATAFIKDVSHSADGPRHAVRYRQTELDRVGQPAPVKDGRLQVETEYRFEPGQVQRIDRYTAVQPLKVSRLSLDFASFSQQPRMDAGTVRFGQGRVTSFEVQGIANCMARAGDAADRSPDGPMPTHIACETKDFELRDPLVITWTLRYR
ncbi:hypothetical protein ACS5PN_30230 [Roseateles sp. NT4]|uniref:hypothetical protein n=1 Tax=Roseateles sp. NT4 TaxID=3453715 RepID=UPI003EED0CD5